MDWEQTKNYSYHESKTFLNNWRDRLGVSFFPGWYNKAIEGGKTHDEIIQNIDEYNKTI